MKPFFIFAAAAVCSIASAQVLEVGVFAGEFNEDFESYASGPAGPSFTFLGGQAVNNSIGPDDIWLSSSHGLGGSKANYSASQAMVANSFSVSPWEVSFASPLQAFGGYWQTAYDDSTISFKFYDSSNNELNTITKTPPNSGELTWYGFAYTGGISKVLITSDQPYQIVDNFTATSVPEPATMAALGLGAAALIRRRRR